MTTFISSEAKKIIGRQTVKVSYRADKCVFCSMTNRLTDQANDINADRYIFCKIIDGGTKTVKVSNYDVRKN